MIRTIVEFEAHDDGFLPWDFALDENNDIVGKHPHRGERVVGFAPQGDTDTMPILLYGDDWQGKAVGLVPVLSSGGRMYQLTSHVVRNVRPFAG